MEITSFSRLETDRTISMIFNIHSMINLHLDRLIHQIEEQKAYLRVMEAMLMVLEELQLVINHRFLQILHSLMVIRQKFPRISDMSGMVIIQ